MKTGIELIKTERARQKKHFGWTLKHDDRHDDGSLRVIAAMCACDGTDAMVTDALDRSGWGIIKRHGYEAEVPNEVHLLAIAGALIAAEIDRLQRKARKK